MILTRNYARALLFILTENQKSPISLKELEEMVASLINRFERNYSKEQHSYSFADLLLPLPLREAKFAGKYERLTIRKMFIDALIDIDSQILFQNIKRILIRIEYLKDSKIVNDSFQPMIENAMSVVENETNEYEVFMNQLLNPELNKTWFNNCDNFIPPLLKVYNDVKSAKGFMCDFSDMEQVIIDYSIVLSYQHFNHMGFLTEKITKSITKILTEMVDYTIVTLFFDRPNILQLPDYKVIEKAVLRDLSSPLSVKLAYECLIKL